MSEREERKAEGVPAEDVEAPEEAQAPDAQAPPAADTAWEVRLAVMAFIEGELEAARRARTRAVVVGILASTLVFGYLWWLRNSVEEVVQPQMMAEFLSSSAVNAVPGLGVELEFLTGTTERVEGVMRIDNAVAWHLLGQDALTIDYHCPSLGLKLPRWILGYRWFWARHMLGTLDLDLRRAAAWVGWVSRLPTRLVREIFSTGVLNDFERFANIDNTELDQVVPEVFSRARKVGFLNRLCRRFEQSGDELFSFYQKVQATRADELTRPEPSQVLESALDHLHGLRQANDELSALVASLDPSGPQQSISAVLSVDSYDVLREALNGNTLPEDDAARHAIYADAIERLEPLLDTADNACELQAIESSLAEVQRRVLLPYEQAKLMENSSKLNRRHFARLYPILPCAEGEARR